jgi:hypothetical protein
VQNCSTVPQLQNTQQLLQLYFTFQPSKIDISNFIYPRLLRFADITNGYPYDWNNITKHSEWIDYVKITAEDIKNLDFKKFILNIEKFWW